MRNWFQIFIIDLVQPPPFLSSPPLPRAIPSISILKISLMRLANDLSLNGQSFFDENVAINISINHPYPLLLDERNELLRGSWKKKKKIRKSLFRKTILERVTHINRIIRCWLFIRGVGDKKKRREEGRETSYRGHSVGIDVWKLGWRA